jgi:hypothetical protein
VLAAVLLASTSGSSSGHGSVSPRRPITRGAQVVRVAGLEALRTSGAWMRYSS